MSLSEKYNKRLKELPGIIKEDRKRVEYLRGKFISKYNTRKRKYAEDIFNQIVSSDPSNNKQYSQWLLNLFSSGSLNLEDLYKATEYLYFYDKLKKKNVIPAEKRDIGKFTSLQELHNLISELGGSGEIKEDEKYLLEDRFFINNGQAELVFENNNRLVVVPKTFDASKFYGCSSQWCTNFPEQFNSYSKDGPLLVIVDKTKLNERTNERRHQFHFPSNQFMNFGDVPIGLNEFLKKNPELTVGLSRFLVDAVSLGYRVLNDTEVSNINSDENDKYLAFSILPEESQKLILKKIVDNGSVVSDSWLEMIDELSMPTYIDNRLRRFGTKKFEDIWDFASNRQKVYYFKKAVSKKEMVPNSILDISDDRMVQFYLNGISKIKKVVPDFLFNKFSSDNMEIYLKNLTKTGLMDINSISKRQASKLSDDMAKELLKPLVKKTSKFPFLLSNEFFDGISDAVKNYYLGSIFQIYNSDENAISDALTKHQLDWGRKYSFL